MNILVIWYRLMDAKKSKRSRRCPDCGWKFPIAKARTPIDKVDGKLFTCPDCQTALIYRTDTELMYRIFTLMTIPATSLAFIYDDNALFETIAIFLIIPLATLAAILCYRSEYIERVK